MQEWLPGAETGSDDFLVGFHLIREIRDGHAESLRVIVGAMARALLRAQRAG